MTYFVSSGT